MKITSDEWNDGDQVPRRFTCDGEDVSPPLSWSDVPDGTRSFALIVDDPDAPAGTWVHWVLFNVPGSARRLEENASSARHLPESAREGVNGWGSRGYRGPCPPSGEHRYHFRLLALDTTLSLEEKATAADLGAATSGHVPASADLMGRYARAPRATLR